MRRHNEESLWQNYVNDILVCVVVVILKDFKAFDRFQHILDSVMLQLGVQQCFGVVYHELTTLKTGLF